MNPMTSSHYNDVMMSTIASQITSLTIVYSIVYLSANQRKYQSPAILAFLRGIHRRPVNSPRKGPVTRKMFPFDDAIMQNDHRNPAKSRNTLTYCVLYVVVIDEHLRGKKPFGLSDFFLFLAFPFICTCWVMMWNSRLYLCVEYGVIMTQQVHVNNLIVNNPDNLWLGAKRWPVRTNANVKRTLMNKLWWNRPTLQTFSFKKRF